MLNDRLSDREIVLFFKPQKLIAICFARDLAGQRLVFEVSDSGDIVDRNTKSRWEISGKAVAGPLAGRSLTYVNSGIEEWFAWAASHAGTEIFDGLKPA